MTEVARKRGQKCVKSFILADGSESVRASGNGVAVKFVFPNNGDLVMKLDDLQPEVVTAAALFGLSTSVSNTFGSADMDEADAFEAASSRWETLLNGGWTAERETGPRTSLLVLAAKKVRDAQGKSTDADWEDSFKAKLVAGTVTQKQLMGEPIFAAAYEEIRAQLAEARRKAAAAKAEAAGDSDLSFLD